MAKALLPLLGVAALCTLLVAIPVDADDDSSRLANTLAVQTALHQGRDYLLRNDFLNAVKILESQLTRIDGNAEYLKTLRDAYRGAVLQLRQAGREPEAQGYQRRLQILDPGAAAQIDPRQVLTPTNAALATGSPVPRPVTPTAPATQQFKARGTSEESPSKPAVAMLNNSAVDPFSTKNLKGHDEAKGVLDRAETAFRGQQYREAVALYQQAAELQPDVVKDARDRWSYCRVHAAVARLNQPEPPLTATELQGLETEVKDVARQTPKLEGFCRTVLSTIDDRRAALNAPAKQVAVTVKHTAKGQRDVWAVAETTNFRIFHNESSEFAEKVAKIAEQTKVTMEKKWLGEVKENWTPRCDIYLHANGQMYSAATQAPPASPGHSTVQNEGSRILSRRVDLHVDHDGMLSAVLPHETTHIVLAGRFGPFQVPRWVDEGIAVLSEPDDKVARHTKNLPRHRQEQALFHLNQLVSLNDYPEPRYVGAFYAQSVSVVQFLSSQPGGPPKFVKFVQDGLKDGYDVSLKRHYGWNTIAELDQKWLNFAFKDQGAVGLAPQGGQ